MNLDNCPARRIILLPVYNNIINIRRGERKEGAKGGGREREERRDKGGEGEREKNVTFLGGALSPLLSVVMLSSI
jgi:hypothetical protein